MTARDLVLSAIPDEQGTPIPPVFAFSDTRQPDLLKLFTARLTALNGRVIDWQDLAGLPDRRWCLEPGIDVPTDTGSFELTDPWSASVGITRCDVAVAETGSLLILHEPSTHRLASLAPPIHVVVVRQSDIAHTLEEALTLLDERNAVLITGPSRTADIEGVLVNGVHGPAHLWVIVQKD